MHERPKRILDTGHAEPNGRRGVVVCYPRSHDYFRRLLARVSADQTPVPAADDPAAKLLSMVQCVLASHTRGGLSEAGSGGDALGCEEPHMFPEYFDKLLHFSGYCLKTQEKREPNEDACALDSEPRKETEPCSD